MSPLFAGSSFSKKENEQSDNDLLIKEVVDQISSNEEHKEWYNEAWGVFNDGEKVLLLKKQFYGAAPFGPFNLPGSIFMVWLGTTVKRQIICFKKIEDSWKVETTVNLESEYFQIRAKFPIKNVYNNIEFIKRLNAIKLSREDNTFKLISLVECPTQKCEKKRYFDQLSADKKELCPSYFFYDRNGNRIKE